jgi:extracellular solute-binding protein
MEIGSGRKILIIEVGSGIADLLTLNFRRAGFRASTAADGTARFADKSEAIDPIPLFLFVYNTDANISKEVKIVFKVPIEEGPAIRCPIANIKEARNKSAAENRLRYFQSEIARKVFEKYGFIVNF